jgi:hypothetical protein
MRATNEMSREDYIALAQRYEAMAEAAKPAALCSLYQNKVEPMVEEITPERARNSGPVKPYDQIELPKRSDMIPLALAHLRNS